MNAVVLCINSYNIFLLFWTSTFRDLSIFICVSCVFGVWQLLLNQHSETSDFQLSAETKDIVYEDSLTAATQRQT